MFKKAFAAAAITVVSTLPVGADVLYSNGFETDTSGWFNTARVASGTNGVPSAAGGFHGQSAGSPTYTNFGGYNFGAGNAVATVFQEYWTSLDIYLNLSATQANDVRFDYTSAVNNSAGVHLRDFVFNAGFYNSSDVTGPGAGSDRFVISASNNTGRSNSYPKNPARDPFAITSTGWYTFQHHFYGDAGNLKVDLSILDSTDTLLKSWSLTTADLIGNVGGNRYGWLPSEFGAMQFDNALLQTSGAVPEPGTWALLGTALAAIGVFRRRLRR